MNKMDLNRRDVLKKSGTGISTGFMALSATGSASAKTSSNDYTGLSYHTATQEAQGRVKATLDKGSNNQITGKLNIAGFSLPIKNIGPDNKNLPTANAYQGEVESQMRSNNDLPIRYKIHDHGHFYIGYITQPSSSVAKLGFTIHNDDLSISAEDIRATLPNNGKPLDKFGGRSISSVGIPEAVIPEESGPATGVK